MRNVTIIVLLTILSGSCVDMVSPRTEARAFADVLREEMNKTGLQTYRDSFFGFVAQYPANFRREEEPAHGHAGQARFCYNSWTHIALECYVTRGGKGTGVCGIDTIARQTRSRKRRMGGDSYVLYGPLYEDGLRIDGYSHYTKCVRSGKLWFVYTLCYPDEYKDSLSRLFGLIDSWKVWRPAMPDVIMPDRRA